MKTKKLTQNQYILFISCAQRMLNHYVKLQNDAKKENQNELVDFYEKEIVEISNLFLELNIN